MFAYFYRNFVGGKFNIKSIRHILVAAKDCKATFRFARNADLGMDLEVKEMLDNLSANAGKFLDYCNVKKSPTDFVDEYAFGFSSDCV